MLIIGDAIEVMRDLHSNSYGAVVTSPPYNIGVDYGVYDDKISAQDYFDFTAGWVEQAVRVAPVVVVNFGAPTSSAMNLARFMCAVSEVAVVQSHIIWVKHISSDEWSHGHFKPVNSERYLTNVHESVFIVSRRGDFKLDKLSVGVPFKDKSNIERFASNKGDVRCRGNVWYVPYETRQSKKAHPATYPLKLAEMMIKIVGTPGRVLDPFYGEGTTAEAAAKLGVACDGIDLKDWTC